MKKLLLAIFSITLILLNLSLQAQQKKTNYKPIKKIHLSGNEGWDYLTVSDDGTKLYVSHGNMVQVVDLGKGTIVGTIGNLNGVHGIALAPFLDKGYISSGRDSTVTVFKLRNDMVLTKIKVPGRNPDAILFDPFSQMVFAFNGGSENATVIDTKTDQVKMNIKLEGKPEFAVSDGKGLVYVNIEDKSMIEVINTKTLSVEKKWPIAPGKEPSGLALDNENHRLFSVCDNKLMVILDAVTGKVITSLPIGEGVDGVAWDPGKKRAYSSNGDGTMTVVQEVNKDSYKVLETLPTQRGARTITVDKRTHHLYLSAADYQPAPKPASPDTRPARPAIRPDSFVILDIEPL